MNLFLFYLYILYLSTPSVEAVLGVVVVLLLLACSALISGSEIAFFSLSSKDYEELKQSSDPRSVMITRLLKMPRKLLATILISNNFINIAIVILSDFILLQFIPLTTFSNWANNFINSLPIQTELSIEQVSIAINFIIITVGITFLLVLFGEVAPKIYAKINNVRLAKIMSQPLTILLRVFSPISSLLVSMTNVMENRLAKSSVGNSNTTSREDIDDAIELTVRMEDNTEQEIDILKSIVKFGEVSVKQIMRSRVDVIAVDFRLTFPKVLKMIRESGYSRIPVYENDFDNVTGIIYVKDLLSHVHKTEKFEWQTLIRTNVLYAPEAKKIDDLLREFQRRKLHMAIVVDEYGGSSGIVTLEDIMEEIIGEIKDEFDDEPEILYKRMGKFTFLFEGKTLIIDMCKVLNLDTSLFDEARGESDSLAGLILECFGNIPKVDQEIRLQDFSFKVTAANNRRIEQVLVTLPQNPKYYFPEERS